MQLYRRLAFGGLLDLHVLDTRQYRSDQACGDGNKRLCDGALSAGRTLLGEAQERWLEEGMRSSSAQWSVLANQIMLAGVVGGAPEAPSYSMDVWTGYPESRRRLVDLLAVAPSPALVLTGDIHSNWAAELKPDFEQDDSPVVGVELVGTSIASGGDGNDDKPATLARNPMRPSRPGRPT
jgi:alkaline phosphatase D